MSEPTRFVLERGAEAHRCLWVMLNPSTADAHTDDPTIRRVRSFTAREGFVGFTVMNLTPVRATNPKLLREADTRAAVYANHDANWQILEPTVRAAELVIVAWGAHQVPPPMWVTSMWLADIATEPGESFRCLGRTKSGAPRHPLYVKTDEPLIPWSQPR